MEIPIEAIWADERLSKIPLMAIKSGRWQKVLADIREYAQRRGLNPDELITRWLEERMEVETMSFEQNRGN